MLRSLVALIAIAVVLPGALAAAADPVPLIPRDMLFGNPERTSVRISPDGAQLAYLAPVEGVLNVWVAPVDKLEEARAVTEDKQRGIRTFFWAYTNEHIIYLQDSDGDENWHVYSVDLASSKTTDLTPLEGVAAQIQDVSHRSPDTILVGLNNRNPQLHDIWQVNLTTGKRTLVQENPGFAGFITDDDYRVRFATRFLPDGGNEVLEPDGEGGWKQMLRIPMEDSLTTDPIGFDKSGDTLYLIDSRERNTGALTAVDLTTGFQEVLASDDRVDVGGVMIHPTENTVQAVAFNYLRNEWRVMDDAVDEDLQYLRTVADGDVEVASRTLDDKTWIVAYLMDDGPVRYYLYEREANQERFLFTNRPDAEGQPFMKMHPVVIPSRDSMELVSYLSLPPNSDPDGDGRPSEPVPLVLFVHGGPWGRDTWGYNPYHQLLANRGYAVLSINFRASTGFGKKFVNAGNKEWGTKMQDDLLDGVEWAIAERIADSHKVAIMGGSYGGYATLAGLTMTPDVFACGVDIVGPSNLITLLETIPPYWQPVIDMFKVRVGDPSTPEGQEFLKSRSPLTYVKRIRRPLLIGQGANDPRVKQAESDQIVAAMEENGIPVIYVLYPDEGHGFARPENRLSFNAVAELFLAEHLGGRYEPIGDDFKGSTISVPHGADGVPGLAEALEANH